MTAFDLAYQTIMELVRRFEKGIKHYTSPSYQESEARQDFIDDFFTALGWDVRHREQQNPYEQEVKIEKSQRQQEAKAQKRADYAFYMAPNFKDERFFVEAKKPAVGLRNPDHYFQTIRYGWSANVPVSILTDFEELHILDCRIKPDIRYVFNGQHKEYRYTDYLDKEKFAFIYWIFSREAVENGSIEKYAATLPKPKSKTIQRALFKGGYKPIDEDFLEYIDGIRETLAKAFKKNDEALNGEELTEAVQRTIDRLVFIRFLEDKLIEPENHVSEWAGWKDFVADCRKLDAKYNGVVFKKHFIDNLDFAGPEERLFKDICSDISNLNSPYQFNYLPIHILGSIYERFLGKVVVATAKRVTIEEKPEVRKAGGVYYTPKYIVDYIVSNTIGKLIEGKTPKEIAPMSFADIACGSGSFLIGVYDLLLEYHKRYYNDRHKDANSLGNRSEDLGNTEYKDGQWILTLKLKQDILLNNIYGIDIDAQAVEVTQLSLFLKMLEDETQNTTRMRQSAMFTKVLPDLTKNIVCGNSLIGRDIIGPLNFSDEEERKLNPMDFETTFPAVMRKGGFDAIVGNPPYVNLVSIPELQRKYFQKKFSTCRNKSDLYSFFIEQATMLLNKKNAKFGYIVPHTWLATDSFQLLRILLLKNGWIEKLAEMGFKVFKDAIVSTVVLICSPKNDKVEVLNKNFETKFFRPVKNLLESDYSIDLEWDEEKETLYNRLKINTVPLAEILQFSRGIKTSDDKRFISTISKNDQFKKIYRGKNIKAYELNWAGEYIWYRPDLMREKVGSLPHSKEFFEVPEKLVTQRVNSSRQLLVAYDSQQQYFLDTTNVSRFETWDKKHSFKFICAVLNSKLINYWYCNKYKMPTIGGYELHSIPFKKINFLDKAMFALHNTVIGLVDQILQIKDKLRSVKTDKDRTFLENKYFAMERQIDNAIYQLYELSPLEIAIIEKAK